MLMRALWGKARAPIQKKKKKKKMKGGGDSDVDGKVCLFWKSWLNNNI